VSEVGREGGREREREGESEKERFSRLLSRCTSLVRRARSLSFTNTHTHTHTQPPRIAASSHVQHVHLSQPPVMNIHTGERVREEQEETERVKGGG
jgi:hypothetical protein